LAPVRRRSARKARRTQQERRVKTRSAILKASLRLLVEQGYTKFSASAVARMDGVSRGAQEHYYRTRDDLIVATLRYAMDEALVYALSIARDPRHSTDPIVRFLADSEHFFLNPRYRAFIEIMVAARAEPRLLRHWVPLVRDARRRLDKVWTDRLTAAGYKPADVRRFIELTHYVLRGLMLVETWLPYKPNRRDVLRTWRSLAPAILHRSSV
jgi:AcrR family transcriptional regulator